MKISVITINYNNCEGLKRTAQSVIAQSYRDFEWIIIDGGSTDGSAEFIRNIETQELGNIFFKWVSESDNGIYNAMNKGVRMATSEYCQFLNSGDTFHSPTALQEVVNEGLYGDIVVGNTMFSNGMLFNSPEEVSLELFIHGSLSHPAAFSKRELLLEYPFDESLKIISDMKFFLMTSVLHNSPYQKLSTTVATFELDGISSTQNQIKEQERQRVLNELIPAKVLSDYSRYLGDTDVYYRLFTTVYPSRLKWTLYNISLFFTKLLSFNRGWVKEFRFH